MSHNCRKKIFVIDDEAQITDLLKLSLERTGQYDVLTENQAEKALAAARNFQPDLILMDVMMPEVDGGQLASLFETSDVLKNVPLVFLTAAVTKDELMQRHGKVGGLRFLAKPVDLAEVLDCLQDQLHPAHN